MGMARLNVQMKTTVSRTEMLKTLRTNRDKHAEIVKEAQVGYLTAAAKAVEKCRAALAEGKVVSLSKFALAVPIDYRSAYDTVITMLEWSTDDTITLAADEFRQFVQDQWDWKDGFLASNAAYSSAAYSLVASSQHDDDGY